VTLTGDRRPANLAFLLCWGAFVAYSFLRVPIPGINEPHYLGMARADWDPAWCRGDLFLESSRPHRAFYLLIGWLTQFLSLEQTAVVGRITSLAVVAWGWSKLGRATGLGLGGTLLSAAAFLLIQSTGSWSGEWLIGGVESKVFAYGFVFSAWAATLRRRMNAAGLWLGLATTLHPIVGIWATVATVCGLVWRWWRGATDSALAQSPLPRFPIRLVPVLWWFVAAAPGIGWALPALRSANAATSKLADFIQVSYRLAHHLDPWTFPTAGHLFFGVLVAIWLANAVRGRRRIGLQLLDAIAGAAILFGLAATALSYGPRPWTYPPTTIQSLQLKMLKFYPFRLADLMAALMVSLLIARLCEFRVNKEWMTAVLAAAMLGSAIAIPGPDKTPGMLVGQTRRDWIATLEWVRRNTPVDSLLLAANEDFGVKWWAQRAEYVNFKDCPQDANGVVEWNSRLLTYSAWTRESLKGDMAITAAELADLGRQTGVTHLIVSRLGPIGVPPAFERGRFRVYDISAAAENRTE
jgi:hypothetical protein